jgi:hypothetical protein
VSASSPLSWPTNVFKLALDTRCWEDELMRMPMVVLAAIAVLQVSGWAEAANRLEPRGGGYVDDKHPRVTKKFCGA